MKCTPCISVITDSFSFCHSAVIHSVVICRCHCRCRLHCICTLILKIYFLMHFHLVSVSFSGICFVWFEHGVKTKAQFAFHTIGT